MASRGRNPKGRYKISEGKDGKWHAWPRVGTKPDGSPKRVHIQRDTAEEVAVAMDEVLARAKAAGGAPLKKIETVSQWLDHYLEYIVRPRRPQSTWKAYRSLLNNWAKPYIGKRRLAGTRNVLEPEHLDELYNAMRKRGGRTGNGMKPASIVKLHNVLSKALDVAMRYGRATRNVCDLVEKPTARKTKPQGYSLEHGQALLREASKDRLKALWYLRLLLGPRQGEALGVRWTHMDLVAMDADGNPKPRIDLQKQWGRGTWQHGCDDPVACAAPRCRTKVCGPQWVHGCDDVTVCKINPRWCPRRRQRATCRMHKRPCPQPCPPGCVKHAMHCPKRRDGGLLESDLKTEGSARPLALPPVLADALVEWRAVQQREFEDLSLEWSPEAHAFTRPDGRPIDPRRDHDEWKDLGRRAGLPLKHLHIARHTAATLLIAMGADISVVQDLLGHADIRTTRGYVGPAEDLQREAVKKLAEAMFTNEAFLMLARQAATPRAG
ncbi:tyrosine-type recombinase/integrase [Dactylosporangium sp. NPDC000555]|uniref:tyrosine-type recombinase/integrase n=1 Tax=Dactylosporangium sp. NPDC000555 TaxID=3154260 RepID=UPI00332081F7